MCLFPFIDQYLKIPNKFNLFIGFEIQNVYNLNRKSVLESMSFYYEEIIIVAFSEYKNLKKDYNRKEVLNVEEYKLFLEIFILKLKEIISKSFSFRNNTNKLDDLIYLYTWIIYIIKKIESILKLHMIIIKGKQHLNFLTIPMKIFKRELKSYLTDFLLLYCSIIKKIRNIIGLNSIQVCNSLIDSILSFDIFINTYINIFYGNIKEILNNLSTNNNIQNILKKYSVIYNLFYITIEQHVKV